MSTLLEVIKTHYLHARDLHYPIGLEAKTKTAGEVLTPTWQDLREWIIIVLNSSLKSSQALSLVAENGISVETSSKKNGDERDDCLSVVSIKTTDIDAQRMSKTATLRISSSQTPNTFPDVEFRLESCLCNVMTGLSVILPSIEQLPADVKDKYPLVWVYCYSDSDDEINISRHAEQYESCDYLEIPLAEFMGYQKITDRNGDIFEGLAPAHLTALIAKAMFDSVIPNLPLREFYSPSLLQLDSNWADDGLGYWGDDPFEGTRFLWPHRFP